MEITDVKIRRIFSDTKLKALVSVTIDGELALHDIKLIQGADRLFVAMPSRKDDSGSYRDIVHPIAASARHKFEAAILSAYSSHIDTQLDKLSPSEELM